MNDPALAVTALLERISDQSSFLRLTTDISPASPVPMRNMAQLTREVSTLPIFICGKIYDRASAEEALQDADIALSGKSMLLNPNWVEDLRAGTTMAACTSEAADIAYTETPLP